MSDAGTVDSSVDTAALHHLIEEIGPAAFTEAVRVFVAAVGKDRESLAKCGRERDFTELANIAHRLKSSSILFGGRIVSAKARVVEELARAGDARALGVAVELVETLDRLDAVLIDRIGSVLPSDRRPV